jgi:hypothetical protein
LEIPLSKVYDRPRIRSPNKPAAPSILTRRLLPRYLAAPSQSFNFSSEPSEPRNKPVNLISTTTSGQTIGQFDTQTSGATGTLGTTQDYPALLDYQASSLATTQL